MARSYRVWVGFALSLVFLYIAFREQDFATIGEALRGANYWYIIPALALYFIGVTIRAYRWGYVLRGLRSLPLSQLFSAVVIGYMANNVLPLRAGEFVRSYVLSTRTGLRKTSILATIAVERVFDGITMILFLLVASLFIGLTSQLRYLAMFGVVLSASLVAVLVVLTSDTARRVLLSRILPMLPERVRQRVQTMIEAALSGLGILRRGRDLFIVSVASVVAWLFEASMYLVIAAGFGLGTGIAAILLVTAVANLATLIPSSPGYVGPFEAGVLLALVGAVGIQREVALSYAIVVHAALYLPITVWGLFYWWRESLSWREVRRVATEETSA
jgi:glycosyltransferase 2 family protein